MNRYTDIGEAVITSSPLSGRAKIRVVQGKGFRALAWGLLVVAVLALVVILWMARGKLRLPAAALVASQESDKPVDMKSTRQTEAAALNQLKQAASAEGDRSEMKLPVEGASQPNSEINTHQQAENAFHEAQQLVRHGKINGALESYRKALLLEPTHDGARQSMIDLLLKNKRTADAERALQLGLKYTPRHTGYAMQLAHIQAERNDLTVALVTLFSALPNADSQAEYQAFVASLLQRQNRHADAVAYYRKALKLQPDSGEWLMGMGVALKAGNHLEEARDAFQRALDTQTLNIKSKSFVEDQLKPVGNAQPAINAPPASQPMLQ